MSSKDAARARALVRERIAGTRAAQADCDAAIDRELAELAARGVVPSCSKGCAHCCHQEILISRAEAETIVDWIESALPAEAIAALGERLRGWLAWYRSDPARPDDAPRPLCVALVDGACSIYPVRPTTCRIHFVKSSPDTCRQPHDPALPADEKMEVLPSFSRVAQPAILQIRALIERQGASFLGTVHLLPEWLAHLLRVEDQPWRTAPPRFRP